MSDLQRIDVTVVRRVEFAPWWSPVARFAERVVRSIPAHRDSRSGRRNGAQVRAGLLFVGIAVVVLADSAWGTLGFVALALAFFVPINESRRRSLVAKLRAARTGHTREERSPGVLELSEKHVTLVRDDERLRRLLRKDLTVDAQPARLDVRSGKKKTEHLVIATSSPGEETLELWVEVESLPEIGF